MIILGIDPGQMTGLAWWDVEAQAVYVSAQQPAYQAVLNVWEWLEHHRDSAVPQEYEVVQVACEKYVIGPRTLQATRQYDALHVAGAVRFKCQELGVLYTEYPPSESKRLVTDERLQRLGLWQPGRGHVHDATRQVLTHLAREHPTRFQGLLDRSRSDG